MSEMIKRAVSAMRATGLDCEAWPQDTMEEIAKAAILAMRGPTKEMISAGNREEGLCSEIRTEMVWQDMIDAALKDK